MTKIFTSDFKIKIRRQKVTSIKTGGSIYRTKRLKKKKAKVQVALDRAVSLALKKVLREEQERFLRKIC